MDNAFGVILPTDGSGEPASSGPESCHDPDPDLHAQEPFAVVAAGASAGGLEAFTELLRCLPADTGMAFVFIQHLAPGHESMLPQLLSRESAMPVSQVEDGTVLAPNHVYVIPPNAAMTISGLVLALKSRGAVGTTIDGFLRSLAESRKSLAIAVILSGTGSDGTLGVQAVAEEGGVVFAQDPFSAKFDGMPRSAIATGCVDFVLPAAEIAAELARVAREPRIIHRNIPEGPAQLPDPEGFEELLDLLRTGTGIDFSLYRQSTVRRRALRRVGLLKQGSLRNYLEHMKEHPDELQALAQDILIRVTHFFRDPEAFEVLAHRVFPALIRKTPDRAVRIWVPGCSTGEEAYSIVICFLEVAEQMLSHVPVQVFATDINEAAIEKARRGVYLENIAADVSPERLARFFVRMGKEFRISRKLRDQCIFSRHDLLIDPPFSRMDLVSCRNVLIYMDWTHEQALSRFHFALNPGGFLLLGKSETASSSPDLFTPLDKAARLYVRQDSAGRLARASGRKTAVRQPQRGPVSPASRQQRSIDLRHRAYQVMVERYGTPWVVVDRELHAVSGGETAGLLASPSVTGDQRTLNVAGSDQGDALKNAVRTAGRTGQSIRLERVKLGEGPSGEVNVEITPLGPDRQHFLIVSENRDSQLQPNLEPGSIPAPDDRGDFEIRISRLRKELASSRARLELVVSEQEAASEEIVASNEELQSLNEELESSKEELEATNEELTTVNQELQIRNTELDSAREFAQATIDTVRSSLVVLGPDLRVLRANQSFYRTFCVSPAEIERRFIYELGGGHWSIPRLRLLLEEVLPANHVMEDFEVEYDPGPAGRRTLLMNARRFEREQRILLAIEDVTEIRRAEEHLRQSQKMEAIGYLAAGVAHDFNNLLTGILGNASLLLSALPQNDTRRKLIDNVISGGERAADLTRQLLAYAGKGRFYLERVDLSDAVMQVSGLSHSSIPHNVQLRLDLDKDLPLLLVDKGQMQQVAMNLIINAAEAIGKAAGTILVRTGRQTVTGPLPDLHPNQPLACGEYVFLEVQDDGIGMDEQTICRIFDPFFTTKFTGRGLGLAAVLGAVRQQKGAIQVHSVPGRGSSFRVLLPASEKPLEVNESAVPEDLRGAGTILVVDDEEMIRTFTSRRWRDTATPCSWRRTAGKESGCSRKDQMTSRLVLLDVAMPEMGGLETMERIREIRPDVPVLVCSGLGDVDVEARFAGKNVAGFFPKPYTEMQLAAKVKACMAPAAGSD